MDESGVNEAFEILLEELEVVADGLNEAGANAFRAGNYERAKTAIEEAVRLAGFRERILALKKEWQHLLLRSSEPREKNQRKSGKRLSQGLRTPEEIFRRPILETLVELGGSSPLGEVLSRIEQKMKGILNEYDYQPLPSDPKTARWRNTAQWCRYTLVQEGLPERNSPHGIWEISALGRQWLAKEAGD